MIIAEFTSVDPLMSQTRTYEHFYKFLGMNPTRLGLVSSMYPWLTTTYMLEKLMNIYYNDSQPRKFQSVNTLAIDWDVEVNQIKRVEIAGPIQGTGEQGTEMIVPLKERYYERYDTFKIEKSRQYLFVKSAPIRKADNYWEYVCVLVDPNYTSIVDQTVVAGDKTKFISNYHPELHDDGLVSSPLVV